MKASQRTLICSAWLVVFYVNVSQATASQSPSPRVLAATAAPLDNPPNEEVFHVLEPVIKVDGDGRILVAFTRVLPEYDPHNPTGDPILDLSYTRSLDGLVWSEARPAIEAYRGHDLSMTYDKTNNKFLISNINTSLFTYDWASDSLQASAAPAIVGTDKPWIVGGLNNSSVQEFYLYARSIGANRHKYARSIDGGASWYPQGGEKLLSTATY